MAGELRADGRPLFAGHAGLAMPEAPHLALWHACTLLREHRFDGHVAALTVHDVDGLAALLHRGRRRLECRRRHTAQLPRMDGGRVGRGRRAPCASAACSTRSGALTAAGRELRGAVEQATDRLAAGPWESLPEPTRRERLFALLAGLAARLEGEGGLIYPNPIGVGRPDLSAGPPAQGRARGRR